VDATSLWFAIPRASQRRARVADAAAVAAARRQWSSLRAPPGALTRPQFYLSSHTKGFPKNTEVEITATYEAVTGGARTTPESRILTGRLHYSFVEPPTGYKPRVADRESVSRASASRITRCPLMPATKLSGSAASPRKEGPNAALSEPKQPIVYYLDAAVPEPTRQAMKDGSSGEQSLRSRRI